MWFYVSLISSANNIALSLEQARDAAKGEQGAIAPPKF